MTDKNNSVNSNEDSSEKTVTIKRKNLVIAGWIAGGALALGGTFAAGVAFGHSTADFPRGGDFAAGHSDGPGRDGDRDGDHGFRHDEDRDLGLGELRMEGGFSVPPAPGTPLTPTMPSVPAPETAP